MPLPDLTLRRRATPPPTVRPPMQACHPRGSWLGALTLASSLASLALLGGLMTRTVRDPVPAVPAPAAVQPPVVRLPSKLRLDVNAMDAVAVERLIEKTAVDELAAAADRWLTANVLFGLLCEMPVDAPERPMLVHTWKERRTRERLDMGSAGPVLALGLVLEVVEPSRARPFLVGALRLDPTGPAAEVAQEAMARLQAPRGLVPTPIAPVALATGEARLLTVGAQEVQSLLIDDETVVEVEPLGAGRFQATGRVAGSALVVVRLRSGEARAWRVEVAGP